MAKALVVYATRTKNTRTIAESIAEGLREQGTEVTVLDANTVTGEWDLEGYDAYIFGSATYHGDMMPVMKEMLFIAERANLAGKAGGAFGAYGWSGEAPQRIYDTMKNLYRMNMVKSVLRIQTPAQPERLRNNSQEYGKELAGKLKA
jgi:flavorubredoxin